MARRRRVLKTLLGLALGLALSRLLGGPCAAGPPDAPPPPPAPPDAGGLLLAGVMTAQKYLETRAAAVHATWGTEVPGRVVFYSSEGSRGGRLPLVALDGVDDGYPPQKKSFAMLKHMHDNYLEKYEWFLRADDDVYVRMDRLEGLLRAVDSRKAWFIGQTGKGNTDEFGLLSLDVDENFCMGGPGVILSRETLRRVAPHLEECLGRLVTSHEDVELGRCVRKYAGVACTWSYEMQVILYHNQSGEAAFTGNLKQKEVHRAITMHPIKQPQHMHRVNSYVKGLKLQKYHQDSILLHRDIAVSMKELGYRLNRINDAVLVKNMPLFPNKAGSKGYLGDTRLLGSPVGLNRYTPRDLGNVLEWELISKSLYSSRDLNPRRRIGSSLKEGLSDVVREVMEQINSYSKQRGRVIDFREILYGYYRLNPIYGADLILDLLLVYKKYRGRKMTVQVRRHAYIQQTFTGIFIREVSNSGVALQPSSTEPLPMHKRIVNHLFSKISENLQPLLSYANSKAPPIQFILPLSGRHSVFVRFLKMYEDICLGGYEDTPLTLVLYKNAEAPGDYQKTIDLVDSVKKRHTSKSDIRIIYNDGETFTRGKALQKGVNSLNSDDLMLFIDVDIVFNGDTLQRIRRNTIQNKTVYFPIVYSLYNPKLLNKTYNFDDYTQFTREIVDERTGFWRQFGFGIAALYKSDYVTLGGFNLQISGWGNEDVTFFDNAVKSNLKIVRCVDPDLFHVYHDVKCEENLGIEQRQMCLGTQASTLGSLKTLEELFLKYKGYFR